MSPLSRRSLVAGSGAVAVAAALGPWFNQVAHAAPTLSATDLETLRSRWVDDLTSRTIIAAAPAAFTSRIATLDRSVDNRLAAISPTPTRYFANLDWAVGATPTVRSNTMRLGYVDLQRMAVAWATPGSRHHGSARVLDAVRAGLAHLHENVYHSRTQWWGNWWSWLIGASRPLADCLAILRDELDQAEIDAYCADMDHFLPDRDPTQQIHPEGPRPSDGANRVDIGQAFIVRALVQPDVDLLTRSVAALSDTWQYVTSGNGFFRDGSFIQHSTIGYTGTYGLVLLGGLARLFALLAGTAHDITDPSRANLTRAVEDSFAPCMYQGQMMDAVRGRAVARIQERSIDNGDQLIEAVLRLSAAVDATTARRWRGLCRQWIESNSAAKILNTTNIARFALATELLASDVAAVPDPVGPKLFPAMDRLIHRGTDNAWAVAVAMCSNRIAWHEGMEAENFRGVKTSQGMTYLYLADDDRHFDDEFWATSDLEAPAGTTVDLTPLPDNPEGMWGERTPQAEWTGGVTFEDLGFASMHLLAPGGTGLHARKSWLTMKDRLIALGSDIATASDGVVRTVVEHRNLGTSPRSLAVDGTAVTAESVRSGARWAHVEGVAGYVLLQDARLRGVVQERSGTWRRNSTGTQAGSDTLQRRWYATLSVEHGAGAAAAGSGYAYVVLPGATTAATRAAAASPGVRVLRNDEVAHGLLVGPNVYAASFWKPGAVGDFTAETVLTLVARKTPGMVRLSVADPTHAQASVRFHVANHHARRAKGRDAHRVTVTRQGSGVQVEVDTRDLVGGTVEFQLNR